MDQPNRGNNNRGRGRENEEEINWGDIIGVGVGIASIAALAGGLIYALTRTRGEEENVQTRRHRVRPAVTSGPSGSSSSYCCSDDPTASSSSDEEGVIGQQSRVLNVQTHRDMLRAAFANGSCCLDDTQAPSSSDNKGVIELQGPRVDKIPDTTNVNNLDSLLEAIYVRYISVKVLEFRHHYGILTKILYGLHYNMKDVSAYYNQYASELSFSGSHYGGDRIEKPDEFDIDIVIRMPVNYSLDHLNPSQSDINIIPQEAGFVELKMGPQFQNLPERDPENWKVNRKAYMWKDAEHFLLRSRFLDWFKGVVDTALFYRYEKTSKGVAYCEIDGLEYTIVRSESGPAITLTITNAETKFKLDFDFVPALRFPDTRWPVNGDYRDIPNSLSKGYFMVVPKPNNNDPSDGNKKNRSWRFSMRVQERKLIYNRYNLKQTLRLMKKLREAKKMKYISTYYLKTLFYWEVKEQYYEPLFWNKSPAKLFVIMVNKLHQAVVKGHIPYFWNPDNNLLGNVRRTVLDVYKGILAKLVDVLREPANYRMVAEYLLTPEELEDFRNRF